MECLDDNSEDLFSHLLAGLNGVVTINQDFRFNDGHESISLADSTVSCKTPGVFLNGLIRRAAVSGDLEHSSPLSESAADGVEFLSHSVQGIQTHGGSFVISSREDLDALVDLDTGDDASVSKELNEVLASGGVLLSGF